MWETNICECPPLKWQFLCSFTSNWMVGEWVPILLNTHQYSWVKLYKTFSMLLFMISQTWKSAFKNTQAFNDTIWQHPHQLTWFLSSKFYFFFFDFWALCDEALESFSLSLDGSGLAFCQLSDLRLNIGQGGKVSWKV